MKNKPPKTAIVSDQLPAQPQAFIRPDLRATKAGLVDVTGEVEAIIDRASGVLEGQLDDDPEQRDFELLAHWGMLRRIRPELISRIEGAGDIMAQLDRRVRETAADIVAAALSVLNPRAWLKQAQALYDRLEDPDIPEKEAVTQACALLEDLDHAEVVLAAAKELSCNVPPALSEQIGECVEWTLLNPEVFYPADVLIQAMAAAFIPELEDQTTPLALTTTKYEYYLNALERAEADIAYERFRPLFTKEQIRQFVEEKYKPIQWLLLPSQELRVAAATPRAPAVKTLYWREPQGQREARLIVPEPPASPEQRLRLGLYDRQGRPCRELAGRKLTLAGVEAKIGRDGTARFTVSKLLPCCARPPELFVDGKRWRRVKS